MAKKAEEERKRLEEEEKKKMLVQSLYLKIEVYPKLLKSQCKFFGLRKLTLRC